MLVASRMSELADGLAKGFGATASVTIHPGYSVLVNDPARTSPACAIAAEIVGEENVEPQSEIATGSEDFSDMLTKVRHLPASPETRLSNR